MKLCITFVLLFASIRFGHPQLCRSVMVCDEDQVRTSKGDKGDAGVAGKAGPAGSKGEKGEVGEEGEKGIQGESCALGCLEVDLRQKLEDLERLLTPSLCESSTSYGRQILRNGIEVFCSHRWTLFQKRVSAAVSFDQNWTAYEQGFGDLDGSFWLGLAKVHNLTSNLSCKLRVDLWDSSEVHTFAEFSSFSIGSASYNYRLHVSGYRGTATDRLAYHNNKPFTTKDRDNDQLSSGNCANRYNNGGWWYDNCCNANLNRPFGSLLWKDSVWFGTYQSSTMKFQCN